MHIYIIIQHSKQRMQPQITAQLSQKCRSILYHLKQSLVQNKLLLDTHICNMFDYRKQKLSRKQFHKIIRKYDQNLILTQIDKVYQQLPKNNKNYVSIQDLQNILDTINEYDNPVLLLNRRSKLLTNSVQIQQANILIQLKDILTQHQQYLQTIQLYMTEQDGLIIKHNMVQLLINIGYVDKTKIQAIIETIFENKDKIQLYQFLQKLELNKDGTRLKLSDYSINQSIILDTQKSQYIRNQQTSGISQQFNMSYSKILDSFNFNQNTINSGIYAIQKIPNALKMYFNYGSQLEESFANLAVCFIQNNHIFIDPESPTYDKAKSWIHIVQYNPYYLLFQAAESIVYRAQDRKGLGMLLQPKDISQGKFGNCYFLSAVAAIVQSYPQLVYRLFVLQKNPSHIFGVRLFIDGIWKTIAVDGCFPLNSEGKFCGAQPHHSQIWVMLLQKAWAKVFKTYENIHSGYNQQGLVAISGAPTTIILIKQKGFLQKIQQQFKKGSIITCTTAKHVSQISQTQQQNLGVFSGHAYTILKIYSNLQIKNQSITLIKMKNPWGTKAWKGDWSYQSKKWTKQLRLALNYNYDSKDGTFFICLQDFIKYFDHIHISKINLGNRNSYITNTTNRYDFYTNVIHIKHAGTYYLTIYQQNGRKYKNLSGVYQKSPSWLFLAGVQKINENGQIQDLVAIACNASGYQHTTIQAKLEVGLYLVISKVSWNYWQENSYVISSYGPGKVLFQPCQLASIQLLNIFISSRALQIINHKQLPQIYYKNTQIWKCFYFEHSQGIGFIAVGSNSQKNCQNIQTKMIQTTLRLDSCKGIQILLPFTNPIVINVKAGEIVVAACLVDPQGYSYKLIQGYKLYFIKNI